MVDNITNNFFHSVIDWIVLPVLFIIDDLVFVHYRRPRFCIYIWDIFAWIHVLLVKKILIAFQICLLDFVFFTKTYFFDCNETWTHKHLARTRSLHHRLWTKSLWVQVPLQSLNFQILRLLRARSSSLTFRQSQIVDSL